MTDEKEIRENVLAGLCPFCGEGPFKVVAGHTTRVHDVDRFELRDLAGLFYSDSICDPDYAEERSELARRNYEAGLTGIGPSQPGHTKTLSQRAQALQREKASKLTPEIRKAVGRTNSRRRLAAVADRDAEIVALINSGVLNKEIADRMDIHPATVAAVARREEIESDGRARYGATKRGVLTDNLRAGHERHRERMAKESAELVRAYKAGASVYDLALRKGVTVKSMRDRLRRSGAKVPDGRADPLRPIPPRPKGPFRVCEIEGCDDEHRARGLCSKHYQRWRKENL